MAGEFISTLYGGISGRFSDSALIDICVPECGVQTGPFGSQLHAHDYAEEGTPIITVEHLGDNRILHSKVPRVTDADKERLSRYTLRTGDIVFSRVGSVDRRALVRTEEDGWLFSGRCLRVRPDHDKIDPGYLSWFFGFPGFQEHIRQIAVGATMPSLNTKILGNVAIYYPQAIKEQQAIAFILGALDDKIELNRQLNRTQEEMAQAIFKSWFVDFDPVRAKAAGQQSPLSTVPGTAQAGVLQPEIAALFPDSFEDSDLGEIPKGWGVGTLGDVSIHPRRGIQPSEIEPSTPYIALEHMPKRCIALTEWGTADGLESNKFEFKKGEILFGKLRPYFHKVGVAPLDGICSTDIVVVASRTENWFGFVLGHVSSAAFVDYTNAGSTGTKMPRTSWSEMARYSVVKPAEPIVEVFNKYIRSAVDRIAASIYESRTLAALRDALLPKLISGELRVSDAERIAGRCL